MKWGLLGIIIAAAIFLALDYLAAPKEQELPTPLPQNLQTKTMNIISPVFKQNELIPKKYTCDGTDVNPPLTISGTPANAKSLVLIVDDPDAPAGTWVHWTVWNINPEATHILENSVPQGSVEGTTDFGKIGYGGPCPPRVDERTRGEAGPPSGTHRYFFKIYALDTVLNLPASLTKDELETALQGHILDQAELIGLYKRS